MDIKNHVIIYELYDNGKRPDDPNAYWKDRTVTDVWEYYRLECCSPGTTDALEEYNFRPFSDMYHYWRGSVQSDKWIAQDEGDPNRDPYNYLMYYVVDKPSKDRQGHDIIEETGYPVKVYKRNNKIFCKYI